MRISMGRTFGIRTEDFKPLYSNTTLYSNTRCEEINKNNIDLIDDTLKNSIISFINTPQHDRFNPLVQKNHTAR